MSVVDVTRSKREATAAARSAVEAWGGGGGGKGPLDPAIGNAITANSVRSAHGSAAEGEAWVPTAEGKEEGVENRQICMLGTHLPDPVARNTTAAASTRFASGSRRCHRRIRPVGNANVINIASSATEKGETRVGGGGDETGGEGVTERDREGWVGGGGQASG